MRTLLTSVALLSAGAATALLGGCHVHHAHADYSLGVVSPAPVYCEPAPVVIIDHHHHGHHHHGHHHHGHYHHW